MVLDRPGRVRVAAISLTRHVLRDPRGALAFFQSSPRGDRFPRRWLAEDAAALARIVRDDFRLLESGQVKPTQGDTRCIVFGHLIRLAVWNLRITWNRGGTVSARIAMVRKWIELFGGVEAVLMELGDAYSTASPKQHWQLSEAAYRTCTDEVSF